MVVCGALVVHPSSSVYTPQDLSNRLVALDFGNGTAYAGLQMLEGAVPREAVRTRSFDTSPAKRYAALMAGEFEATVPRALEWRTQSTMHKYGEDNHATTATWTTAHQPNCGVRTCRF